VADPCGVPRSRSTTCPSGIWIGAFNQRFTYNTTHFWSVDLHRLDHEVMVDRVEEFLDIKVNTQSFRQHRSRHLALALHESVGVSVPE
jgi:hypothetical protein